MKMSELLEMGSVSRLVQIKDHDNNARPSMIAANTACRLDVLGRRLRLPLDDHQAEPQNVQTDRNHVRC